MSTLLSRKNQFENFNVAELEQEQKTDKWRGYSLESWANFVAIDSRGIAIQFEKEPYKVDDRVWYCDGRMEAIDLSEKFGIKNWQNSVERV